MTKFGFDSLHDDDNVPLSGDVVSPEFDAPLSSPPATSSQKQVRVPRYIALIVLVSQIALLSWIGRGHIPHTVAVSPARPPTGRIEAKLLFVEQSTVVRKAEIMPGAALFQGLPEDRQEVAQPPADADAVPQFQVDLSRTVRLQVASPAGGNPTVSASVPLPEASPPPKKATLPARTSDRTISATTVAREGRFTAEATFYYPDDSPLQGGYVDRETRGLRTVQEYIKGEADYISVAIDVKGDMLKRFPYGTEISIPTLEAFYRQKYGLPENFQFKWKLVDTGEAFYHRGTRRLDICVENWDKAYNEGGRRSITWSVKRLASDDPV